MYDESQDAPTTNPNAEALVQAEAYVAQLRAADADQDPQPIIDALIELCRGPAGGRIRDHLDEVRKGELLEVQWSLEEVLEAVTPKKVEPEPEPVEPEPEEDPDRPLTAADLTLVYDDPSQGLMLYKAKKGTRWFATQVDPRTGAPQTFELRAQEVAMLKQRLAGSPYWLIGG